MLLKRSPSTPSTSPSPDAAAEIEALKAQLELSTQSRQAALKAICIRRDGYRCVITKARDHVAVMDGHVSSEGHRTAVTVCAHVISFGLRKLSEEDEREVCLCNVLLVDNSRDKPLTASIWFRGTQRPPYGGRCTDIFQV